MANLVRQLANILRTAWHRQADIKELSTMSDDQLADIGLRREQIFQLGKKRPENAKEQPLLQPKYRQELAPCG